MLVKKIFSHLPIKLQNLMFTGYGYLTKNRRYSGNFKKYLEHLSETEWFDEKAIDQYQNEKLLEIIQKVRSVPFYQEFYSGIDLDSIRTQADLKKLPILEKKQVKKNPLKFISNDYKVKNLYYNLTSGTTGTPLKLYFTKDGMKFQWATFWRHRKRFGFNVGDKFIMFGARLPILNKSSKEFWRVNKALNQHYVSSYEIKESNFIYLIDYMNKEKFDFIVGYPSAVYNLVSIMKKHNVKLDYTPKYFFSASDVLLPIYEKTISEYLGCEVTDFYGSAEFCGNFSRCEYGKYHLDFESGIVEFLDIPGNEDSEYKKMVFTGISNFAMPLIRYDIGDYAKLSKEKCKCGRRSVIIDRIEGRTEDYIFTPDGRAVIGMNQAFEWTDRILEAQIIQDDIEKITIKIVKESQYSAKDEKILLSEIRSRVGDDITINLDYVDMIPTPRNGKKRLVISSIESTDKGLIELKNKIARDDL
jgi:phenylacetate-CoA ligase